MKIQRAIEMEFLGTAILAFAIVGSGIVATNLTSDSAIRPIREQIRKLVEDLIPTLFN